MAAAEAPKAPGQAGVAVGAFEAAHGLAREEEILEHALFDERDAAGDDAFAVHGVVPNRGRPRNSFCVGSSTTSIHSGQDARAAAAFELAVREGGGAAGFGDGAARGGEVAAQDFGEQLRGGDALKQHRAAVIFAAGCGGERGGVGG